MNQLQGIPIASDLEATANLAIFMEAKHVSKMSKS